ncbi:unnamed protein product [Camellia sinensis]
MYDKDQENWLGKLFWADSRSRLDYAAFGDVLVFDTTYKTNAYNKPFVIFVRVNNHFETTIFACNLLVDETIATYTWILQKLLETMDNKRPVSVLIDGDMAMREAIQKVFPNAKHRLCNWHMHRNAKRNVRANGFEGHFKHLMDLDVNEVVFEEAWSKMVRKYEADAEAKTDNSDPCLTTTLQPLEKHAATIFTRHLFLMFRNEIIEEALLIFDGRKEEFDHRIYKFSKYTEFGSTWEVSYHPATSIMKCSCKKFEFFGLPCSHMISVMKCEHMTEILPSCVMYRWTKQARKVGEQYCEAQFSSTLTQETRFGVLCSSFTEMCYYASQTSEGFEEARNAFFTMTCRMKQLCMAKGTNVDEGKSSLPPFGVGDSKVVNTKRNTGGSYMAKPRKPRRCQCCRSSATQGELAPKTIIKRNKWVAICLRNRMIMIQLLSKDVNDLRSCDAQVVQNSAFIDADTSLGVAMGNSCYDRAGDIGAKLRFF